MRRAQAGLAVAVAALLAGCPTTPENGFAVDLTVDGSALAAAVRASVRSLEIATSGAETSASRTASAQLFAGGEERLIYRPVVRAGALDFAVTARNENGVAVGYGTTSVTLKSGGTVTARVALGAEVPLEADLSTTPDAAVPMDLAATLDLTEVEAAIPSLMPLDVTLARNGTQAFSSNLPVAWSLEEGAAGGTIGSDGSYTAPGVPGVYHVIATAGATKLRARVTVLPTSLAVLAGNLGGPGNLEGIGGEARLNRPLGIASDGTDLYVSEGGNHVIRKIVIATGQVTVLAGILGVTGNADGPPGTATFNEPQCLALDGSGNLFVADYGNQAIRKIVIATGVVSTLTAAGALGGPVGVVVHLGNLYISDYVSHTIRRLSLATNALTTAAGTANTAGTRDSSDISVPNSPLFNYPSGIVTDGASNLYIADVGAIRRLALSSPTTTTTTFLGVTGRPAGLAVIGTNLYYTEQAGQLVRTTPLATAGGTTVAGSTPAGSDDGVGTAAKFNAPFGIVGVGTDTLYVADEDNHAVRKITLPGAAVTTPAGKAPAPSTANGLTGGFNSPTDFVVDESGTAVYVTDLNNHAIRRVLLATGEISTVAGLPGTTAALSLTPVTTTAARFALPRGLARDGTRLYVADRGHHAIRAIDLASNTVSTLAGNGVAGAVDGIGTTAARFNSPIGLTLDGGELLVTDVNQTVKRVGTRDGEVRTLWGTASMLGSTDAVGKAARFHDPQSGAIVGRTLFIVDNNNATLRAIDLVAGGVTTPYGAVMMTGALDEVGTAARFSDPSNVLAVPGALLIADRANNTIRMARLEDGRVSTVIGTPGRKGMRPGAKATASLSRPTGLALMPAGELVIGSLDEHVVMIAR